MTKTTIQDGREVAIGDVVEFKCDVEQSGQIDLILDKNGRVVLALRNEGGFDGEYIGGEIATTMDAEDCW